MYFSKYTPVSPNCFTSNQFMFLFLQTRISKPPRMNHSLSMETDEEDDEELGDLCAEILENWNSPTCTSHHNPFSLDTTHDVQTTDISTSKVKYNDRKQSSEMEHKDNKNEPSIVPVLVADTFFDKLLQRYVDGVSIADLNEVQETNAHENEPESSTVSANNGKRMEKISSGQVSSSLFKVCSHFVFIHTHTHFK